MKGSEECVKCPKETSRQVLVDAAFLRFFRLCEPGQGRSIDNVTCNGTGPVMEGTPVGQVGFKCSQHTS